jgi:nucleoside 2-deoxyribosyltransferase
MKLYLSGPMRGYPKMNFPEFHDAAEHLRHLGYEVISPAEIDEAEGAEPIHGLADYVRRLPGFMERDLMLIDQCDGIATLDGWEKSTGARIECAHARSMGKEIKDYLDWVAQGGPLNKPGESILEEAQRIVNGPRRETYGHPKDHHARTAAMWGAYLGIEFKPEWVGVLFILDKLVRERNAHTRDNLTDIAGYAQVVQLIHEARSSGTNNAKA